MNISNAKFVNLQVHYNNICELDLQWNNGKLTVTWSSQWSWYVEHVGTFYIDGKIYHGMYLAYTCWPHRLAFGLHCTLQTQWSYDVLFTIYKQNESEMYTMCMHSSHSSLCSLLYDQYVANFQINWHRQNNIIVVFEHVKMCKVYRKCQCQYVLFMVNDAKCMQLNERCHKMTYKSKSNSILLHSFFEMCNVIANFEIPASQNMTLKSPP